MPGPVSPMPSAMRWRRLAIRPRGDSLCHPGALLPYWPYRPLRRCAGGCRGGAGGGCHGRAESAGSGAGAATVVGGRHCGGVGLLETQARALNPGFIARMTRQRPYIRIKIAASVDGRTAMASGESQWITGPAAREDVQRLRARSSAVITGVGTVLADRPSYTVRPGQWALADYHGNQDDCSQARRDWVRQPVRIILDRTLRTPPDVPVVSAPGHCLLVAGSNIRGARMRWSQPGLRSCICRPLAPGSTCSSC